MGRASPDDRGWLAYVRPAVAQGHVLRVVGDADAAASRTRITKVEIFADAVRVSWCDLEPPQRDEPVEIGAQDYPHWQIADCGGAHFANTGGGFSKETVDGRWVEHGHCIAATPAPHTLTEVRLTDGDRTMALQLT